MLVTVTFPSGIALVVVSGKSSYIFKAITVIVRVLTRVTGYSRVRE